jgi:phosphonate transport system permease protein
VKASSPYKSVDEVQIRVLKRHEASFLILLILITVSAIDWISGKLRFAIIGQRAIA